MNLDAIWKRARADLLLTTARGDPDIFLWEHSARVAKSALAISKMPEAKSRSPDEAAVLAAGLYHDAGWVARWKNEEIDRIEVLLGPTSDVDCERGAAILTRRLAGILSADSLEFASRAVRLRNDRSVEFIEAHIIAEAESLDEFGVLPLWISVRRGAVEGKGVQAILDTWHRKKEYQFWKARLNDSFRFDAVRALAQERLAKFERLMSELQEQHGGEDIAALCDLDPAGLPRI